MRLKIKNRKQRKKRKIQLKRMGLEVFIPDPNSIITTFPGNLPKKKHKHFNGNEIKAGKMTGYEFTRSLNKVKF